MREHGLEWLHRLVSEPRRLWKRYLVTNTLFILGALRQMLAPR
jgi:N-acetylglucosaminyldiphosphoundecaprenol N-acetyl-beta-D-mannosaminyltransferase